MDQAVRHDPGSWETYYALAIAQASAGIDPGRPPTRALRMNPLRAAHPAGGQGARGLEPSRLGEAGARRCARRRWPATISRSSRRRGFLGDRRYPGAVELQGFGGHVRGSLPRLARPFSHMGVATAPGSTVATSIPNWRSSLEAVASSS